MKIVILAAGKGPRLGNLFPKPLTLLNNGKSIMEIQVQNPDNAFHIEDIGAVIGYKKESIMENANNLFQK